MSLCLILVELTHPWASGQLASLVGRDSSGGWTVRGIRIRRERCVLGAWARGWEPRFQEMAVLVLSRGLPR